jgi:hypothetical protein
VKKGILPPPGFAEPIPDLTPYEDERIINQPVPRFDLSLIDECVRKVASWPTKKCPNCGLVVSMNPDEPIDHDAPCDLCALFGVP